MPHHTSKYLGRSTLILGDVKTGKTAHTKAIVDELAAVGNGDLILVLDLAPETMRGVGGKLNVAGVAYRTAEIVAPRLTATKSAQIEDLALQNAGRIDLLLAAYDPSRHPILVVNDASLYLQAGDPSRFSARVQAAETAIVNAYHGNTFADSPFTRRERLRVENLTTAFDRVIRL